jgi:PAS domain S-box-containing protein
LRHLSRRFVRGVGIIGLAVLCIAMLINTYGRYRATEKLIAANGWVQHALRVNAQVEAVGSLLKDAETGQRGYLLTGQEGYLQPYFTATEKLPGALEELDGMISDKPEQAKNLQKLRDLSASKLSELKHTIELNRQGHSEAARSVVQSNLGKNDMDEIRATLRRMDAIERNALDERERSLRGIEFKENLAMAIGLVLRLMALIGFAWTLDRLHGIREETAAEIAESEEWLSTTISSIGDAIIATGRDGNVRFLNPVAENLTQFSQASAAGKPLKEVFPIFNEVSRATVENPVEKVILSGKVVGLANHTVLVRPDGSEIAIDDSAAPIFDRSGKLTGVVLVFRDVTKQREIETAMRISEKLAATGKLAATVAHEINNPLEAASNLLYLMHDETLSEPGKQYLKLAEEQLLRVSHIARQTLAFFRDPRRPRAVDVNSVCDHILNLYRPRFNNKALTVTRDYQNDVVVFGTEGELAQVISNLVSNAIDASDTKGSVNVTIALQGDRGVLTVTDSGVGIPAGNISKVFEPFFTTKQDVGTGLGLWVSKEIVQKLGGTIAVSSPGEGLGASFTVRLPLHEGEKSSAATEGSAGDAD